MYTFSSSILYISLSLSFIRLLQNPDKLPINGSGFPIPSLPFLQISSLTLPIAKARGFLFLPLLHWIIPKGITMSYTMSTS